MCGICDPVLLEALTLSFSGTLMFVNTQLRNSNKDEYLVTTIGRRVFGELGYAAILLVSLVEAVVRAILIIPALLVCALYCFNDEVVKFARDVTLRGALTTLAIGSYGCVAGLVKNIYKNTIKANDLEPCCLGKGVGV